MSNFPYPGLRSFESDETDIFFGRDDLSNQLIERLGDTHFIAVVGISGCGKSSLVRTGLLPGLKKGFMPTAGIRWSIAEMRPGNSPFANLAKALLRDTTFKTEYITRLSDDTEAQNYLTTSLNRGSLSLHEILQEEAPLPPQTNLLLVIDQFEELFRHYQRGEVNETEKFINLLLASSKPSPFTKPNSHRVYVVITMRSDFISDCAWFEGLPDAINQGLFLTPPLTREQLRETIELPARVFEGQVEPTLTTCLLNEMEKEPDQLPVLQHALMRMWHLAQTENIHQPIVTLKHYEQIGGLKKALAQHAEEAFAELTKLAVPAEPQKIAEILFRRLCERDEAHRDTRSPVPLKDVVELAKIPEASWKHVADVIEVFRKANRYFLTPPLNINSVIDISHESLIQHWKRLKDWTEQEAESAKIYRRLEDSAYLWKDKRADLLSKLELEFALDWRNQEQPSAIWAKRYSKEGSESFELAMHFLKESEQKQQRQQQEAEAERLRKQHKKEAIQRRELKQARKQRAWAIIGLIVAIGLATWGFVERNQAISAQQATELTKLNSQLNNVAWLGRFNDYQTAKGVLKQIAQADTKIPIARRHAYDLLTWFNQLMGSGSEYAYQGAEAALSAVAVSPNGKWLVAAGEQGTVVLFDINSGELLQHLPGHKNSVKALVFHPEGKWLASAGYDQNIILWTLPSGAILNQWKTSEKVRALAISPNGQFLASAGTKKNITLWDVQTRQVLQTFQGHQEMISGLAFSADGKILASASNDGTARLWQVETGQILHTLTGHTDHVQRVTFSPDNKWLATSSKDTTIRLWDVKSGKTLRMLRGHKQTVFGVRFIEKERYLVSASDDHTLRLWKTQSGVTMRVLQAHTAGVFGIATFENEQKIFSASNDGTVRRWSTALPSQRTIDLSGKPTSTAIAPDGNTVAVGFANGALHLYALSEPEPRLLWQQEQAHAKRIPNLTFNSDGTWLASASFDQTAKVWQINPSQFSNPETSGQLLQTFSHQEAVSDVSFSPTDNTLATITLAGQISLLTVGTKQKRIYQAHKLGVNSIRAKDFQKYVHSISYHPNGSQLLSTSPNEVHRWNLNDNPPQLLQTYTPSQDRLKYSSFSPDGETIASVGREQKVFIYSSTNPPSSQYALPGHENTIYRAIFSPDGQQVATVSSDATLRFWDLYNGNELFTLRLPTNSGWPVPLRDFDFRCIASKNNCWIAVPLTRGELKLYQLKNIYRDVNAP